MKHIIIFAFVLVSCLGLPAMGDDLLKPVHDGLKQAERAVADRITELEDAIAGLEQRIEWYTRIIEQQGTTIGDLQAQIMELEARLAACEAAHEEPAPIIGAFHHTTWPPVRDAVDPLVTMFVHADMDPELDGLINVDLFRGRIEAKIPEPDHDGLVCLDLEGPYRKGLHNGEQWWTPEYKQAVAQMVLAAETVRAMRPNVKIAYWDVPHTWAHAWRDGKKISWNEAEAQKAYWINCWRRAVPLIEAMDWCTPCVYDHHLEEHDSGGDAIADDGGVAWKVELCRAVVGEDVLVLPSVSPRTFARQHGEHLDLIPEAEFIGDQLRPALEHADGFVWWGSDKWYYEQRGISREEIEPGLPWPYAWDHYFRELHGRQWGLMEKAAGMGGTSISDGSP